MRVISLTDEPTKTKKALLIKALDDAPVTKLGKDPTFTDKFVQFWDLMDTINIHSYSRAAMSVIGRSAVGTWWTFRKHPEYGKTAKNLHRRTLYDFYMMTNREWDNIKDWYSFAYKIMIAVMYLKYFGQCAFHIIRDKLDNPIGLDFLHGFVVPNVDEKGYFKTPAFLQYINRDSDVAVTYENPRDIVYIINPDWEGYVTGGTDVEALTDFTLPLDLYLQTSAREYIKNRSKPEAFYVLSPDISDEAFNDFAQVIEEKYMGAANSGKSPVVVKGELEIKELSSMPTDLPYAAARKDTRDETLAITGVPGTKVGLTEGASSDMREYRREFHETSMIPLFKILELGFYEQVHVREYGILGWELKFNNPDFLTLVERATVDMRYWTIGAVNPNEIRYGLGKEPREDKNGDLFIDQLKKTGPSNTPLSNPDTGSPVEGREDEPDDPAQTGEPTNDDQDPPRGDNHDEEERVLREEMNKYRTFILNRLNSKHRRTFNSEIIPEDILESLNYTFSKISTKEEAEKLFEEIFSFFKER